MSQTGDNRDKALSAFVKLQRASMTMEQLIREKAHLPADLTMTQFAVLEALLHKGRLTHNEIARKILTTAGNITHVVDQLQGKGMVDRKRCEQDRRRVYLHLTERGRLVVNTAFKNVSGVISDAMAALSEQEQRELGRLCKKLGTATRYPQ